VRFWKNQPFRQMILGDRNVPETGALVSGKHSQAGRVELRRAAHLGPAPRQPRPASSWEPIQGGPLFDAVRSVFVSNQ